MCAISTVPYDTTPRAFSRLVVVLLCLFTSLALADDQQASTEYTDAGSFQSAILNVTNTYRRQHNATDLFWNNTLANYASSWSSKCKFKHSGGPNGENLASGYPNASASIVAWGHERVDYDFSKGNFDEDTGHFTQLVWKSTKTVGCGRTECDGKNNGGAPGWYVVCEYYPPGNVLGAFVQNVQAQVPDSEQPQPSTSGTPSTTDSSPTSTPTQDECPLGAVCSGGTSLGGVSGRWMALWIALVGCFVSFQWT